MIYLIDSIVAILLIYLGYIFRQVQLEELQKRRKNTAIMVNIDEAIICFEQIMRRAEIYVKNSKGFTVDEYISKHLEEQTPIAHGIRAIGRAADLGYQLIFVTAQSNSIEDNMRKFLGKWGLSGMIFTEKRTTEDKVALVQALRQNGFVIRAFVDSLDCVEGLRKALKNVIVS
jgi:hypothetical protein